MGKITYQEFRPGKWVKVVDGKVEGPVTPDEVASWKREQLEQARIWEDVVKQARPKTMTRKAEGPPEAQSRQEDTEWAEQVRIWRDAGKQATTTRARSQGRPDSGQTEPMRPEEEAIKRSSQVVPTRREPVTPERKPVKESPARPAASPRKAPEATRSAVRTATSEPAVARPEASRGAQKRPAKSAQMRRKAADVLSDQAATRETQEAAPKRVASPAVRQARVKPKAAAGKTASPRASSKGAAPAAPQRPNQLYLWVAASGSDDLIATLRAGLSKYQTRFEQAAEVVLCHPSDLEILDRANLAVDLREGKSIPRHNLWIGLK